MSTDTERDDDLERAFYDAFFAGMYVTTYDDAPNALKLRLRLALELIDGLRDERTRPRARVVTVRGRDAA